MLLIQELKAFLDNTFKIKDLDNLGYFLGIEAHMDNSGLNLCQRKYACDILDESGFLNCKPMAVSTPMVPGHLLNKGGGDAILNDVGSYRRLVGRLLYLTTTPHPEIAYVMHSKSPFSSSSALCTTALSRQQQRD
ncbi:uncharacterized protein LOC116006089 [Ipomoea triloba]|uniref:uncharacterized protein LOC116006089 n=1 Tax=Ipomoea triloba TaxID=35885 RepID=UPI00125E246A|nr:uncharacterized protein LOC116006089 [Ipomoea triloba]